MDFVQLDTDFLYIDKYQTFIENLQVKITKNCLNFKNYVYLQFMIVIFNNLVLLQK